LIFLIVLFTFHPWKPKIVGVKSTRRQIDPASNRRRQADPSPQVAMHEMMEEHEPEQSSSASTSSTARRNDHLQGEEDEGHEGDKRLLERADVRATW